MLRGRGRILVADRELFTLTLYRRRFWTTQWRRVDSWGIAIGKAGYRKELPRGVYTITGKSDCPDWQMPDAEWVPAHLRGTILPCGHPENPIRARWLEIYEGAGIHGTLDRASIGTAASHGCLRMLVEDVVELYRQVPIGTPIVII